MPRQTLTHEDYTVAWLCDTAYDFSLATSMLDERHGDLPKPVNDPGGYALGSVGDLNVVLYCLPFARSGEGVSATVTLWMMSTFRSVRYGVLVGCAGGNPYSVCLGDVVVSANAAPCLIGPMTWLAGDISPLPPDILLTGVTRMMSAIPLNTPADRYIPRINVMRPDHIVQNAGFAHPVDVVFPRGMPHRPEPEMYVPGNVPRPCGHCDMSPQGGAIIRQPRGIFICFGSTASINPPILHPDMRDAVMGSLGRYIDCFDTDTAGVMEHLPCIAVRGISCYADEHSFGSAPVWRGYAGAAAAAVAKRLLYDSQSKELGELNTPDGGDSPHQYPSTRGQSRALCCSIQSCWSRWLTKLQSLPSGEIRRYAVIPDLRLYRGNTPL